MALSLRLENTKSAKPTAEDRQSFRLHALSAPDSKTIARSNRMLLTSGAASGQRIGAPAAATKTPEGWQAALGAQVTT